MQSGLKIALEFMITQMPERTRHKGPSNRLFCYTNVLGIETADLVIFTEEILNRKLNVLCNDTFRVKSKFLY